MFFSNRLALVKPGALAVIAQLEEQDGAEPAGMPLTVAVPLPLSVNFMPGGKALAPATIVVPDPPFVCTSNVVERPCVNVKFVLEVGYTNSKPVGALGLAAAVESFELVSLAAGARLAIGVL